MKAFTAFCLGALTGAVILRTIDIIRAKKNETRAVEFSKAQKEEDEKIKESYEQIIKDSKYDEEPDSILDADEEGEDAVMEADTDDILLENPFEIDSGLVGDNGYTEVEYTLYADGVLTDDEGGAVDEVEADSNLSLDILKMFKYSDESVIYIRNPIMHIDYTVTKVEDDFGDTYSIV